MNETNYETIASSLEKDYLDWYLLTQACPQVSHKRPRLKSSTPYASITNSSACFVHKSFVSLWTALKPKPFL